MKMKGAAAADHLMKDNAEGVDVACGADEFAANLFGAGVLEGHRTEYRYSGVGRGIAGREDFGDAEIQELDLAFRSDENVRRLEVTVDVVNGVADLQE